MISTNPQENVEEYAAAALKLYLHLPETPLKASSNDRQTAANLHARGISLETIESALLLASTVPGLLSPGHPRNPGQPRSK